MVSPRSEPYRLETVKINHTWPQLTGPGLNTPNQTLPNPGSACLTKLSYENAYSTVYRDGILAEKIHPYPELLSCPTNSDRR